MRGAVVQRGPGRRAHAGLTHSCGRPAPRRAYVATLCNKDIAMTRKMTGPLKPLAAAALALAALSGPALALEPLSQERYINDRLIAARIADRIRRECPTINGRLIYAYGQARALERYALDKGYSRAQVDAFLDSKEERKRIYAVAEDYMARNGVTRGDPQSFCRLGMQEIANRTVTGSLLVAK